MFVVNIHFFMTFFFYIFKQDLLFNNSGNGYLQQKLKNDRKKKKQLENAPPRQKNLVKEKEKEKDKNKYTDSEIEYFENELTIMKQMNLPEELELLKTKLENTLVYRQFKIQTANLNIHDEFNYIFTCPDLVSNIYSLPVD